MKVPFVLAAIGLALFVGTMPLRSRWISERIAEARARKQIAASGASA